MRHPLRDPIHVAQTARRETNSRLLEVLKNSGPGAPEREDQEKAIPTRGVGHQQDTQRDDRDAEVHKTGPEPFAGLPRSDVRDTHRLRLGHSAT